MHLSGPLRACFPRDQLLVARCPPRQVGRMTVIAISEVDPQGMVHWSTPIVCVPALRADSIVM